MLTDLAVEVRAMVGLISEPARSTIARRLALMLTKQVQKHTPEKMPHWTQFGISKFLKDCEVAHIPEGWVPNRLEIETTKLAEFCNRWMQMTAFRQPGEEEWTPITVDMNSIRATMVAELKALDEA
jgi:hypothetical protein